MDWEVIWYPILPASGLGPGSVEVASVERQGADLAFVSIKADLSFLQGNITHSVIKVGLSI